MADWESFRKNHYELLGNAIVKNLDKKGYSAEYVVTAEEAKRKIIDLIPERPALGSPGA